MRNKKAWIRIVEAFIAALLILIILLSLYSRPASQKSLEEIEKIVDASLNEVVNDNHLRQDILNNQTDDIKVFLGARIPNIMNFSVKICEVEEVCSLDFFREEVIARERIVSSTLQEYRPKKIRVFVWEEYRARITQPSEECVDGQSQSCTASNGCSGTQNCSNNTWSTCITRLQKCSDGSCKDDCTEEIPSDLCTDGTAKNSCNSTNKPKYCNSNLILVNNCSNCGCSVGDCQVDGSCAAGCVANCTGKSCGESDGCGGTCSGACDSGTCVNKVCVIEITGCQELTKAGKTYKLMNSKSAAGTCFTIKNNSITLDLNGFNITGDYSYNSNGVDISGYNSAIIKNGGIYNFDYGIKIYSGSNNNILTNITANNNMIIGIWLLSSSNNLTNIIASNNRFGPGIKMGSGSNNNILTNITANNNDQYGIQLDSSSNNVLTNIIANKNAGPGIYLGSSSNNILTDITANNNTDKGITLDYGSNNKLVNSRACGNTNYDLYCSSQWDASSSVSCDNTKKYGCSLSCSSC